MIDEAYRREFEAIREFHSALTRLTEGSGSNDIGANVLLISRTAPINPILDLREITRASVSKYGFPIHHSISGLGVREFKFATLGPWQVYVRTAINVRNPVAGLPETIASRPYVGAQIILPDYRNPHDESLEMRWYTSAAFASKEIVPVQADMATRSGIFVDRSCF